MNQVLKNKLVAAEFSLKLHLLMKVLLTLVQVSGVDSCGESNWHYKGHVLLNGLDLHQVNVRRLVTHVVLAIVGHHFENEVDEEPVFGVFEELL